MGDLMGCDRDFTRFLAGVTLPILSVTPDITALDALLYDRVTAGLLVQIHAPVPVVVVPVPAPVVRIIKPLIFTRAQFQIAMKVLENQTKVSA